MSAEKKIKPEEKAKARVKVKDLKPKKNPKGGPAVGPGWHLH
jgi:hypothetical protein